MNIFDYFKIGLKGFVINIVANILTSIIILIGFLTGKIDLIIMTIILIALIPVMFILWGYLAKKIWKWD